MKREHENERWVHSLGKDQRREGSRREGEEDAEGRQEDGDVLVTSTHTQLRLSRL